VQGGERAAVRALQARANAATRRLWKPKTHLFLGEYLAFVSAFLHPHGDGTDVSISTSFA
jgi:hypothetical protein